MYYVYVLKDSQTGTYYVGYTENLKRRLEEHTRKQAMYTKRGNFVLVYYEAYRAKEDAMEREKQLKKFKKGFAMLVKRIKNSVTIVA